MYDGIKKRIHYIITFLLDTLNFMQMCRSIGYKKWQMIKYLYGYIFYNS